MTLTDPTDTPGMARFGESDATGITHEWLDRGLKNPKTAQTDAIGNLVSLVGGVSEGSDFNASNRTTPNRRKTTLQIFKEDFQISRSQARVATAGVRDKFGTEARVALQEVLRAGEARIWSCIAPDPFGYWNVSAAMTGNANHERRMATFEGIISQATGATNIVDLGAASAPAAVTEDDLLDLFMKIADTGGKPDLIMCHHRQKRRLNRLLTGVGGAGAEAPLVRNAPRTDFVPGVVRGYESDLGEMDIVGNRWVTLQAESAFIQSNKGSPNTYQTIAESDTLVNGGIASTNGAGRIWVLTSGLIKIADLDKPHVEDIAKKGDALYGMIVGEFCLEVNAPLAGHGVIRRVAD
jgi:hypothetical protein